MCDFGITEFITAASMAAEGATAGEAAIAATGLAATEASTAATLGGYLGAGAAWAGANSTALMIGGSVLSSGMQVMGQNQQQAQQLFQIA